MPEPSYLQRIDTSTTGNRQDVTTFFADADPFDALVADLAAQHDDVRPGRIARIDGLGFILGTALARTPGVRHRPAAQGRQLPVETLREPFVDYSGPRKAIDRSSSNRGRCLRGSGVCRCSPPIRESTGFVVFAFSLMNVFGMTRSLVSPELAIVFVITGLAAGLFTLGRFIWISVRGRRPAPEPAP